LDKPNPGIQQVFLGVFWFLEKLCRLYFDEHAMIVTDEAPTKDNLKTLHKTTKKVADDIENSLQYFGFTIYDLCQRTDQFTMPLRC
jgi:leucyl-tRNA synthetase